MRCFELVIKILLITEKQIGYSTCPIGMIRGLLSQQDKLNFIWSLVIAEYIEFSYDTAGH